MKFVWAIHWPKTGEVFIPQQAKRLKDARERMKDCLGECEIVRVSYTIERRPRVQVGKSASKGSE